MTGRQADGAGAERVDEDGSRAEGPRVDGPHAEGPSVDGSGDGAGREPAGPRAACVLCQEPSEYPESHRGITLCVRCAWLEGQRTACSG